MANGGRPVRSTHLAEVPTQRLQDVIEIVVPLDGSSLASGALPVADLLADQIGAKVIRVTVIPPEDVQSTGEITVLPGIGVTLALPGIDAAETIVEYLIDRPQRLMCMSTHGRGRLGAGLLGSVAENILHRLDTPVLLVGPETTTEIDAITRIVACVDGSAHSEAILPVAADWAKRLAVRLDLVQVIAPIGELGADAVASGDVMEASYVRALARWLAGEGIAPEWEVLHGKDPVGPILSYAADVPGTIVALATHGRTGWSRVAMGSVAMRIAHESPVPLLVLRPPALESERRE
jgi:nucleotide-binding universal stress UspA family protein